jgi:hypothetical protein
MECLPPFGAECGECLPPFDAEFWECLSPFGAEFRECLPSFGAESVFFLFAAQSIKQKYTELRV